MDNHMCAHHRLWSQLLSLYHINNLFRSYRIWLTELCLIYYFDHDKLNFVQKSIINKLNNLSRNNYWGPPPINKQYVSVEITQWIKNCMSTNAHVAQSQLLRDSVTTGMDDAAHAVRHHKFPQHLDLSTGTDWVDSEQPQYANSPWCQRSILLNLFFTTVLATNGNKVINPAAYLRWLRSGWSRSSECTAGSERAVSCRGDGHHMNGK